MPNTSVSWPQLVADYLRENGTTNVLKLFNNTSALLESNDISNC